MSTEAVDTAAVAQPGQPDQGAQGQGADGLYAKYLQEAPEELRPFLTDALSRYSREAVEPKFREAADFRKTWEPFAEAGFNEIDPEELVQAYNLAQVFNDPSVAEEVLQEPEAFQEAWEKVGESLGFFDDEEEQEGGEEPQAEALTADQVRQILAEEFQRRESVSSIQNEVTQKLDGWEKEHGDVFDRDAVLSLATTKYRDAEDALDKAYDHYMKRVGGAQSGLLEGKMNGQPAGALSGGQPASEPQTLSLRDDSARQAALSRLRGS